MRFLRENWIWIAVPVALFAAAAVYLYTSGSGSYSGPGGYDIHRFAVGHGVAVERWVAVGR